jgi:hypothetical protein
MRRNSMHWCICTTAPALLRRLAVRSGNVGTFTTGDHSGTTGIGGGDRGEMSGGVHHTIHHRQHRLNAFDLLFRHAEIVFRQHHQIGQLTFDQTAFLPARWKPRAARRPQLQRDIARQTVVVVIHRQPATVRPDTSQYSAVHGL